MFWQRYVGMYRILYSFDIIMVVSPYVWMSVHRYCTVSLLLCWYVQYKNILFSSDIDTIHGKLTVKMCCTFHTWVNCKVQRLIIQKCLHREFREMDGSGLLLPSHQCIHAHVGVTILLTICRSVEHNCINYSFRYWMICNFVPVLIGNIQLLQHVHI